MSSPDGVPGLTNELPSTRFLRQVYPYLTNMILKKSANNDTSDSVDIVDVQVKSLLTNT